MRGKGEVQDTSASPSGKVSGRFKLKSNQDSKSRIRNPRWRKAILGTMLDHHCIALTTCAKTRKMREICGQTIKPPAAVTAAKSRATILSVGNKLITAFSGRIKVRLDETTPYNSSSADLDTVL